MARKQQQRKEKKKQVAVIDDNSSDAGGSMGSGSSFARSAKDDNFDDDMMQSPPPQETAEEELDEAIEELTERRSTLRVKALEKLTKKLLQCLTVSCLRSRKSTLIPNILACCKKEGVQAARALAIIGITLGPDQDSFYLDVRKELWPLVKKEETPIAVRNEALASVAMCCFICTSDEDDTLDVMKLCETYFNTMCDVSLTKTAMDTWGFLASIQPTSYMANVLVPEFLQVFVDMLDHTELDIRISAGENIALLVEAMNIEGTIFREKSEVSNRLYQLSKESSKKNTKKDRKEQRTVFRDIYSTVEEGEDPVENLTIQNEPMSFSGWAQLLQLRAVKRVLKTGFQEHIQFNALLRPIFDLPEVDSTEGRRNLITEKRATMSKSSAAVKQRCENLKDDRRRKNRQKNAFLDEY